MNISGLLEELNIEIQSFMAINTSEIKIDNNLRSTLKKMEALSSALKTRYAEIEGKLGFFEKRRLKSDVQELLKIIQNNEYNSDYKIFEADLKLSKICAKYKVSPTIEKTKFDVDKELKAKQEAYNPGLSQRIAQAYDLAKKNRKERGYVSDEQVTTFNTQEIKEAAERAKKIDTIKLRREEIERENKERAARVSAVIDKRREEKRKSSMLERSIGSKENSRYESIMARKIRELIGQLDEEKDVNEKISIRYELQNDTYYINGEPVIVNAERLITKDQKEAYIKSKIQNKTEFSYLFDRYNYEEELALKNCDPYIIGMLLSKDIRLARDYVKQMAGVLDKKASPYTFDVTYDVRGLETKKTSKGKKLSFKERRSIRKTAKMQKRAAKVIEDKQKLPWYAAIPVIGALAIGGIAGVTASLNGSNQDNNKGLSSGNSYSDNIEPGTTTDDNTQETTENITTTEVTSTYTTQTTTRATTTAITTEATTTTTQANDIVDKDNSIVDDSHIQTDYTDKNDTKVIDDKEEKVIVNIGDKISVEEGLRYTADCLGGGNSNTIGAVSWRPATEYNVDRVAFVYQGRVLKIMNAGDQDIAKTLNEVANMNGIKAEDINTSVLLSLVPGIGDTGWANISMDKLEESLYKTAEEQSNEATYVDFEYER